ncbi:MAG: hypothetical protein AB1489_12020 [Acidobacteriota bacterium]
MNTLKKCFIITLIGLLLHTTLFAQPIYAGEKLTPAQVKAAIANIGQHNRNMIKIKLSNKKKHKGFVRSIEEDQFILIDTKQGALTIPYADVQELKEQDPKQDDLGTFAKKEGIKTGLAIGAAAAVVGIVVAIVAAQAD